MQIILGDAIKNERVLWNSDEIMKGMRECGVSQKKKIKTNLN